MKNILKYILTLLICIIIIIIIKKYYEKYCNKYNDSNIINKNNKIIMQIMNAKSMEDIFAADTINLQISDEQLLSSVSAVHIAKNEQIYIIDERFSKIILQFDKNGEFIRRIGGKGNGPGEFMMPRHIMTNNNGDVVVSDGALFRISLFNNSGNFLHSFSIENMLCGLIITPNNEIVLHDQFVTKRLSDAATVSFYNMQGKLLYQFGTTSSAYHLLKNIPVWFPGPYMAIDGDSIFEMDYADYRIRKYWNEGKSKLEFGIQPDRWHSLLATNYNKIPLPEMADAASLALLRTYMKNEFYQSSRIIHIQSISPGILMIMLADKVTGDLRNDNYFCFYDTQGNLLRQGLTFHQFTTEKKDSLLNVLVPVSPAGLCIFQSELLLERIGYTRLILLKPKSFLKLM